MRYKNHRHSNVEIDDYVDIISKTTKNILPVKQSYDNIKFYWDYSFEYPEDFEEYINWEEHTFSGYLEFRSYDLPEYFNNYYDTVPYISWEISFSFPSTINNIKDLVEWMNETGIPSSAVIDDDDFPEEQMVWVGSVSYVRQDDLTRNGLTALVNLTVDERYANIPITCGEPMAFDTVIANDVKSPSETEGTMYFNTVKVNTLDNYNDTSDHEIKIIKNLRFANSRSIYGAIDVNCTTLKSARTIRTNNVVTKNFTVSGSNTYTFNDITLNNGDQFQGIIHFTSIGATDTDGFGLSTYDFNLNLVGRKLNSCSSTTYAYWLIEDNGGEDDVIHNTLVTVKLTLNASYHPVLTVVINDISAQRAGTVVPSNTISFEGTLDYLL